MDHERRTQPCLACKPGRGRPSRREGKDHRLGSQSQLLLQLNSPTIVSYNQRLFTRRLLVSDRENTPRAVTHNMDQVA